MKFSELKGRAVVDVDAAHRIGTLENVIIDPASHQIMGIKVKPGLFSGSAIIAMAQVQSIGQDAITVTHTADMEHQGKDSPLSQLPDMNNVIGLQVVTQGGKLVGEISDVMLEATTLAITGYEVGTGGLFAKKHELAASPDLNFGARMVVIPDPIAAQIEAVPPVK